MVIHADIIRASAIMIFGQLIRKGETMSKNLRLFTSSLLEPNQCVEPNDDQPNQSVDPNAAQCTASDGIVTITEVPVVATDPDKVEFCERPADIPGLKQAGVAHWWLRTPHAEAGMGPEGAGVPGEGTSCDYPGIPTTINDHTGQGNKEGATCVPVEEHTGFPVDQECVDEELKLGRPTGRWFPGVNDCHDAVDEVLDKCRKRGYPSSGEGPGYSPGDFPVDADGDGPSGVPLNQGGDDADAGAH